MNVKKGQYRYKMTAPVEPKYQERKLSVLTPTFYNSFYKKSPIDT